MKNRVLALGSEAQAQELYPDAVIKTPEDWDPYNPPSSNFNRYNAIVAYFTLQKVVNPQVENVMLAWKKMLKKGGELHVNVPALEWLTHHPRGMVPPIVLVHLWGTQQGDDYWMSGYTMLRLRSIFQQIDMDVRSAQTFPYKVTINGQDHKALQHYIVGVKP